MADPSSDLGGYRGLWDAKQPCTGEGIKSLYKLDYRSFEKLLMNNANTGQSV
tara:strand:+ start:445 stop:600 length:156 start_codon:yes stop_codon:yes gene_type:complete